MHAITYRMAEKTDFADIIQLTSSCVNAEPAYMAYMRDLQERLGVSALGVLAHAGDTLAGVALVEQGPHLTGGRTDFFERIEQEYERDTIWSGAIVAVDPAYRKEKVGMTLQLRAQEAIRAAGGRHLLLEIWVRPDGTAPSGSMVRLAPHTDYGTVSQFYDIPALAGHVCQVCGPHCQCSARIALLHL